MLGKLLPMHLPPPPPELVGARCESRDNRSAFRRGTRLAAWRWVEWIISSWSYYWLGSPKRVSDFSRLGSYHVTGEQMFHVVSLFHEALRFVRLRPDVPKGPGRGTYTMIELLKCCESSLFVGESESSWEKLIQTAALPIEVDKLKVTIPPSVAHFRPEEHLSAAKAAQFLDFGSRVLDPPPPVENMPTGCYMVAPDVEVELRHYLLSIGMASLMPVDAVATRPDGRFILAGLFGVHHKSGLRMIFDRRPANWGERRLKWARLPNGVQFARIRLRPGWGIRGSGDDLRGYFHQVRDAHHARSRNCFGRSFDGVGFERYGGSPGELYKLCLETVAMGNLNAVDICQQAHEDVLRRGGLLTEDIVIRYPYQIPPHGVGEGVYIDDHIVFLIAPVKQLQFPCGPDKDIIDKSHALYTEANLFRSVEKGFGFANDGDNGEQSFLAWGTRVDSDVGRVGADPPKRLLIAFFLFHVVALSVVRRTVLKRVVALCIHPLLHRREFMSFLHRFFTWFEQLTVDEVRVPADICEELVVVGLHLAFATADIRAPVCSRISCTDATPQRGGAVDATVSKRLAEALYDASESQGRRVRLDRGPCQVVPEDQLLPAPDPIVSTVARCVPWQVTRNHDFSETQHINIQELAEVKLELEYSSVLSQIPERCVNIADSRVAVGAWARGRSSSFQLNGILRQAACWKALTRKVLVDVFAVSGDNPGDDPSRDVELRSPETPPDWLEPDLVPQSSFVNRVRFVPRQWRLCREIFAGKAGLSLALVRAGLSVGRPLEAFPRKGVYVRESDLLVPEVFNGLVQDIIAGVIIFLAFGTPCSSWSILARRNNSRSQEHPAGDLLDAKELTANKQAELTATLCNILYHHGGYFTIENPATSLLFRYGPICELGRLPGVHLTTLDQCAYGLQLPGTPPNFFCKKTTTLLSNVSAVSNVCLRCPGKSPVHQHHHAQGCLKVDGKSVRASVLAGAYPVALCDAWAQAIKSIIL